MSILSKILIFFFFNIISDNILVKFHDKINMRFLKIIKILPSGKPDIPPRKSIFSILRYILQYGIFLFLFGLSLLYRGIVQLRMTLYRRGIFKRHFLPCPVVSIGNVTTGGTGKTPMTILIARILRQHGKRITILSRGYRRSPVNVREKSSPPLVGGIRGGGTKRSETSGAAHYQLVQPDSDVHVVGDEPLLMVRTFQQEHSPALPDVSVIVGSKRYLSGKFAIEHFQPDVILLDDGFQHIQLERTFDLVLIDATNPFGGGYMLPAGLLREPLNNFSRAHAFVITRSDEISDISPICQRLRQLNPEAPIFKGIHVYEKIKRADTDEPIEIDVLKGKRILGVSGLANPSSFHRLLDSLGLTVAKYFDFPDHHWYTEQDIRDIRRAILTHQLDGMMTTEKDMVKLLRYRDMLEVPVYVIAITLDIQPHQEFKDLLINL